MMFALATLANQAPAAAVRSALDDARKPDADTASAAAVGGCLRAMARLDLTVLEAHVLLAHAVNPERTIAATAADIQQPTETVLNAVASLFMRRLVLTPHEDRLQLTPEGEQAAAVVIGCTATAQAAHHFSRLQKPAAIPA